MNQKWKETVIRLTLRMWVFMLVELRYIGHDNDG